TISATNTCGGSGGATTQVVVQNVSPQLQGIVIHPRGPGLETWLNATFTDPGKLDTFTVTINWGDGSEPQVLLRPAGQKIRAAHIYRTANQYSVGFEIADDDGGTTDTEKGVLIPTEVPRLVTAPDAGGAPNVKVFDGQGTQLSSFLAFRSSFSGG